MRNKAQDVVNSSSQYGVGGLHPEVKAITDQILNPPKDAPDTVRTLQNFASQISAARGNPNLPRTAGAQLSQMQGAIQEGLDNTVKGLALDQPGGKAPKLTPQDVTNYQKARQSTAQNYTLEGLEQRQAITPEGRLNTKKFDNWSGNPKNAQRLNNQDLSQPLNAAASAQRSVDTLKSAPLAKTAEPNVDPVKVVGQILNSKTMDAAKQMHDAMAYVADSPEAVDGLKAVVAKHINENVAKTQNGTVGRPNDLATFFNKNQKALSEVYSPQELVNVKNVAAEIQRNQQYERMANIKGQSNTLKNAKQMQMMEKPSLYNMALEGLGHAATAATLIGERLGGWKGMVAGYGSSQAAKFISNLRDSGIKNREMLELQMYKDPEFFRAMSQRFDQNNPNNMPFGRALAALKKNATAVSSLAVSTQH